jgi:hypothetical protein
VLGLRRAVAPWDADHGVNEDRFRRFPNGQTSGGWFGLRRARCVLWTMRQSHTPDPRRLCARYDSTKSDETTEGTRKPILRDNPHGLFNLVLTLATAMAAAG